MINGPVKFPSPFTRYIFVGISTCVAGAVIWLWLQQAADSKGFRSPTGSPAVSAATGYPAANRKSAGEVALKARQKTADYAEMRGRLQWGELVALPKEAAPPEVPVEPPVPSAMP